MQGRLQGKRLHAPFFLDEVLGHDTEGCNYLLAVDVEMNTVPGYAISSWESGYGDMVFTLDLDTIRLIPWLPATVMIQCDLTTMDGTPVTESPRTILAAQVAKAAEKGWTAFAGTELEFIVFDDTYEAAWNANYRDLTPANQYNVDYSILGTTRVEPLLRDIRNSMYAAGMVVESAKGECNFGQHEIAFRFAEVVQTADNHVVYKNGAKEIAALHGQSLTFMSKFNEREGNSCHIHLSLRGTDGGAGLRGPRNQGAHPAVRPLHRRHPGHDGRVHPAVRAEHQLLQAVRRRFLRADHRRMGAGQPDLLDPAGRPRRRRPAREPAARRRCQPLPGHRRDAGRRDVRHRARAGAGARAGRQRLHLRQADRPAHPAGGAGPVPRSAIARATLGDAVVDHYVHAADTELAAFNAAVTDWELRRGFERL